MSNNSTWILSATSTLVYRFSVSSSSSSSSKGWKRHLRCRRHWQAAPWPRIATVAIVAHKKTSCKRVARRALSQPRERSRHLAQNGSRLATTQAKPHLGGTEVLLHNDKGDVSLPTVTKQTTLFIENLHISLLELCLSMLKRL